MQSVDQYTNPRLIIAGMMKHIPHIIQSTLDNQV